jgi:hypothetical protein
VSSASIWDSAPTTTSTLQLHFSASKFPRENHAVKVPKDAFSRSVKVPKDAFVNTSFQKTVYTFEKNIVSEISHAFQKHTVS